ncbi:MAG: zinc ABC transporter substrate-binding protein [Phycisphaeraceae bacterium]|nr:zinc ABC transporter substrate-binding protein [Phycisphaeraceae bacterium]HRJ49593.1 zinc ABC transporter substrate-binding protein [Phycisphaerales bacterium]
MAVRMVGEFMAVCLFVVSAAMAGLGLAGCERESPAISGGRPVVVATTGMIGDVARVIAGDRADVRILMGEGVDPHLYKASPGDVRLITKADLVLFNGLHLEGRMGDVLEGAGGRVKAVGVAERIDPSLLRSPPEFEGNPDPHLWFDVSIWSRVAEVIRDHLIEADPAGREQYEKSAAAYLASLSDLHEWCRSELARIPEQRRVLVTAHDAFGYFGRAYGIEVLAIQGVSTDSEASLRDIAGLVDMLVRRRVPAVFVESSVPRKTIDALIEGAAARGHVVRIGGELFSDAMGPAASEEGTYIGMIRHNVRTIVAALADAGAHAPDQEHPGPAGPSGGR